MQTELWGDDHRATGELFGRLADELTRCQVDHELRLARLEAGQIDSLTVRYRLGLADPSEPVKLGFIDPDTDVAGEG
jgi:hypothetical protein